MCHVSQCWPFMSLPNHTELFLLPSCHLHCSTPLKGRAWHQNPSRFPSLLRGAGERGSDAANLFLPCCVSLSHPSCLKVEGTSPCRHLLCFGLSWQQQLRFEEPWDCRKSTSPSYLLQQLFERASFHEFSANQYPSQIWPHGKKQCWHKLVLVGLTSS